MAEKAAEEAGGGLWLLLLLTKLIELAACVRELFLGLIECVLLDQHCLGEDVERVGVSTECPLKELLGFGILLRELRGVDAFGEGLKHLFFLRSHGIPQLYGLSYQKYDANIARRVGSRG